MTQEISYVKIGDNQYVKTLQDDAGKIKGDSNGNYQDENGTIFQKFTVKNPKTNKLESRWVAVSDGGTVQKEQAEAETMQKVQEKTMEKAHKKANEEANKNIFSKNGRSIWNLWNGFGFGDELNVGYDNAIESLGKDAENYAFASEGDLSEKGEASKGGKVKAALLGALDVVKGIVQNPVKTITIGLAVAGVCAIPVVGPFIGFGLAVAGVGMGLVGLIKGACKAYNAKTKGENLDGWREAGQGFTVGLLSFFGAKKMAKGIKARADIVKSNTQPAPAQPASTTSTATPPAQQAPAQATPAQSASTTPTAPPTATSSAQSAETSEFYSGWKGVAQRLKPKNPLKPIKQNMKTISETNAAQGRTGWKGVTDCVSGNDLGVIKNAKTVESALDGVYTGIKTGHKSTALTGLNRAKELLADMGKNSEDYSKAEQLILNAQRDYNAAYSNLLGNRFYSARRALPSMLVDESKTILGCADSDDSMKEYINISEMREKAVEQFKDDAPVCTLQ